MYFQYKDILEKKTDKFTWEIYEQENFVKVGNENLTQKNLMFRELKIFQMMVTTISLYLEAY